jgi:hypothetical protein
MSVRSIIHLRNYAKQRNNKMGLGFDKAPASRAGISQVFVLSATSQPTSTFGTQTYQIRVATTDTPCVVKIGQATVVADTTSDHVMGTNVVDYFCVTPGQQAALIALGAPGTVKAASITEMS